MMRKVAAFKAYDVTVECPYCGKNNHGFAESDPRGGSYKCDWCPESFKVLATAKITFEDTNPSLT